MNFAGGVDHYLVLGLPSGEEGARLTEREITRAYKLKALVLHPDKRPGDPNAHADFLKILASYETLVNPVSQRRFDESLLWYRQRMEAERQMQRLEAERQRMEAEWKWCYDPLIVTEKQERKGRRKENLEQTPKPKTIQFQLINHVYSVLLRQYLYSYTKIE
ncbi:hypothetical protein Tsubulata_028655 [Turnera subulata]|uniref:J domain-containing protein n=1 Tax=Turnera subulata TaxID=218843 RepID=A0A9Q0J7S9_9ROSI|nr:hypothetical protein Tsubulata_028655 [Turnera subulata]